MASASPYAPLFARLLPSELVNSTAGRAATLCYFQGVKSIRQDCCPQESCPFSLPESKG